MVIDPPLNKRYSSNIRDFDNMEGISISGLAPFAFLKPTYHSYPFEERHFIVDNIISLGRSTRKQKPAKNNLFFDLDFLRINHASLLHKNGKFYLQKNGDNPTYINDERLFQNRKQVYSGDIVQLGKNATGVFGKTTCIRGVLKLFNSDAEEVKCRPRRALDDCWRCSFDKIDASDEEEKEQESEFSADDESSEEMPRQENISKRKRSESDTSDDEEKENESADESGYVEDSPKDKRHLKKYQRKNSPKKSLSEPREPNSVYRVAEHTKNFYYIRTKDKNPPKKYLKKNSRGKSELSPLLKGSSASTLPSSIVTQHPKKSLEKSHFSSIGKSLTNSDAILTKKVDGTKKILEPFKISSKGESSNLKNVSRKETHELPSKKHVYKNLVKNNDNTNKDVSLISSHKTRKRLGSTKLHHTSIKNKISKNGVEDNQAVILNCSNVTEPSDLRKESNKETAYQNFSPEKLSYEKENTAKVSLISETSPGTDASGNKFNKFTEKDNSDLNLLTKNLTGCRIITDDASISEIKVLEYAYLNQTPSVKETSENKLTSNETAANLKVIASNNEDYYNHLVNLDTCFFASSYSQFYASAIKKLSLPGSSSEIVPFHKSNEIINNSEYVDSALEKNSEEKFINEGSSSRDSFSQNESSVTENNQSTQIPPESRSRDCLSQNESSETEKNQSTQIFPESCNLHLKNESTLPSEKLAIKKQFAGTIKKIGDCVEISEENFEIEGCNIISEFESSVFEAIKTESIKKDMLRTVLSMLNIMHSFQDLLKKI